VRQVELNGGRPRLVVAVTYGVYPPLGGGQVRAYNLYRGLAGVFDIELVTLAPTDATERRRQIAPGLLEHSIPKSPEHAARELSLEREAGTVVTDIAMSELHMLTPAYLDALRQASAGARAAVACHPYTYPAIREVSDVPVWYEAQDVEASLKRHVLGDNETARWLLTRAEEVERACCEDAELIWACSDEDRDELMRRYGVNGGRVIVVPNGAALDEVDYVEPQTRRQLRDRLRLHRLTALFIASWHHPNVVGARRLPALAERLPDVDFVVVGSVGLALAADRLPANLQITGQVSAAFKRTLLSVADVALNPVTTGSGTNLKMLEYFAAGVPVVSTGFGARGLGVRPGEHYVLAEPEQFESVLASWRERPPESVAAQVQKAREHVQKRLAWSVIADELLTQLKMTAWASAARRSG
jgi:glycosyltransferase involved in cell wall biosynthesis